MLWLAFARLLNLCAALVRQERTQHRGARRVDPAVPCHGGTSLPTAGIKQGDAQHAARLWSEALRQRPNDAEVANNLAWLLATSRDREVQDTFRAVCLSEQACQLTQRRNPRYLDTLAIAYAAAGRLADAAETLNEALRLEPPPQQAADMQKRLSRIRDEIRRGS